LQGAFTFAGFVQILHGRLNVSDLLAESVVLPRFHFHLILQVLSAIFRYLEAGGEQITIRITLLEQLFDSLNFHFPQIDLILILLLFYFVLLMDFFCD
jgi:hypothetical protein